MITIKVEGPDIAAALARLASGMAHPGPVMPVIAGIMHDAVMENFAQGGRPAWTALKPATLAEKKKRGYGEKILIRRGGGQSLLSSITQQADAHAAHVGTNVVYAAIHQFGGKIDMPARSQQAYFKQYKDGTVGNRFVRKSQSNFAQWHTRGAHTIEIPPRPFLQLTEADEEKIARKLLEYLADRLQGG
ncbi:phage virion morphogenesis protein [Accumulibacter sp.]|uniref:phage virion morphogenesis protein n=1 Tax=Accumulibacter sp. TaxID=2053492 RepID=UPI002879E8FD|nr:phage virion morphogenesis protein [Accumulibacter sp.]MDS4056445.1 phage virion morphogenesis protein [Accumulibacter sp.]HMW55139.1 phage virion morphogenesis protein [Accumulibacter sp.]HMW79187.1 phage virion morphogenesis protein [Accumulibacter sp.]